MDHKLCQKNDQIAYGRALHKRETGGHATANWLYWEIMASWFAILKKLKKYESFISVRWDDLNQGTEEYFGICARSPAGNL
jgi:hypothetical protein